VTNIQTDIHSEVLVLYKNSKQKDFYMLEIMQFMESDEKKVGEKLFIAELLNK